MNFLIWFTDISDPSDAKRIQTQYGDIEDAVHSFLETHWHDYDCPQPPISISIVEADEEFASKGKPRLFDLTTIDYDPVFFVSEVTS